MKNELICIIFTLCFMFIDILTGIVLAFKTKSYNSSTMREGGFHKFAILIVITLSCLIQYSQKYLELGFNVKLVYFVCIYFCSMEICSTVENVGRINPKLVNEKLQKYFTKLGGDED